MMRICTECGCENAVDTFWCVNCNAKLHDKVPTYEPPKDDLEAIQQESESNNRPIQQQYIMPKMSSDELETYKLKSKKSSRTLKIFGGATIAAIILLSAMILPSFLFLDGVSASEIKAWTLNTYPQVSSYSFSIKMDMTSTTSGISGGSFKSTMIGSGVVDNVNEKLKMETSTNIPGQGSVSMSCYILNNILYLNSGVSGIDQWMKINLTQFGNMYSWYSYDQMQMQVDLLSCAKVERLPDENVNGKECYVLKIIPDLDKLCDAMMEQQGLSSGFSDTSFFSDMMDDFTIKIYTEKSTDFIIKSYQDMSMDMSFGGMSMSMDMHSSIVFSGYNQPVNVVLPEDALNAVDYIY